jgi:hypothetical protein
MEPHSLACALGVKLSAAPNSKVSESNGMNMKHSIELDAIPRCLKPQSMPAAAYPSTPAFAHVSD